LATDRSKQAEEDLRESESRYRALAESSPLAIFVNREDKVVLANLACVRLFGASSPKELIGTTALDLFDSDSRALVRERIRVDSEEVPLVEARIIRLDGTVVDVEATASPLLDQGVRSIQVLLRDITERKHAEQELLARTDDLARSNAELENFAYIASHDLQEPLRMVASYTQLLQRRYQGRLDSDADEFIAYAVDGATRMQTLINDLLAYSRVGTQGAPFSRTDLEAILGDVLRILEMPIAEAGAIVTHDPMPVVTCDPTQIGQVFQNLITNAVKFRGDEPPRIHVSVREGDGEWTFSVADNGIGIEAEYFDRIFVIFQRLQGRAEYPGSGVGLAICKRIIERHGGRAWVESQPGTGSTFYFTLRD
jgi:PAS domain S-box-containing protein